MSTIDWRSVRDEQVPELSEDDPVLTLIRAQLAAVDNYPPADGNDPVTGRPYRELRQELRRSLLFEIEQYRWRKAGFQHVTREMLGELNYKHWQRRAIPWQSSG